MRQLHFDLLQLQRRAGGGSHATHRGCPTNPRDRVFGRDADHGRGDDHVTRAFDAIDRGHGIDGGRHGQRTERESGESRGPKPPDIDLGVQLPLPASGHPGGHRRRRSAAQVRAGLRDGPVPAARQRRRDARGAPARFEARRRAESRRGHGPQPGGRRRTIRGGGIRQAMYAAQSFIRIRRLSNRSLRR